ncbi:tumor necrosis factor-like [Ruditapes philippinarum]|uniref:tumor necrosis factor-like n=1 Tax=Ruditapes philippinarum TaxID=129788 RepID=UPI00295BE18D|nr:tumor necrosis factor-like [Ruditapes philippinarum]
MDKVLKFLTIIVFFLAAICITFVLTILCSMLTTTQNDHICLPNENGQIHCGAALNHLRDYLDKSIDNAYNEIRHNDRKQQQRDLDENRARLLHITDQSFWEARPAIRLEGKEQHIAVKAEKDKDTEMVSIREWLHNREEINVTNAFSQNRVRYRNGRIVVPVDGTYFLYSLLDFLEVCDPSTGKPNIRASHKPIKHALYKFNILEMAEIEIVSNLQPHQVSENKYYNSYSSYVSTVARLKAGDEISVKVSNISYLQYTKDNSFGLYLI